MVTQESTICKWEVTGATICSNKGLFKVVTFHSCFVGIPGFDTPLKQWSEHLIKFSQVIPQPNKLLRP